MTGKSKARRADNAAGLKNASPQASEDKPDNATPDDAPQAKPVYNSTRRYRWVGVVAREFARQHQGGEPKRAMVRFAFAHKTIIRDAWDAGRPRGDVISDLNDLFGALR